MCRGRWRKLSGYLCSSCRAPIQETYGVPSDLEKCVKCGSRWITNGVCDKCMTVMEWLKTDRPWYTNNKE
jgi:Zn-finger nucleic acid-binding protein